MKIISPTSELAVFPAISHKLSSEQLLNNHPAAVLFETITLQWRAGHCILEFKPGEALANPLGDMSAMAGCMVDLAVRATAEKTLGPCELPEYEMRLYAPFAVESLKLRVDIEAAADGCATYCCTIYRSLAQGKEVLAESQGTLLFRSTAPQTSTSQLG